MKRAWALPFLLLLRLCWASVPESPIVTHSDANDQREFQNAYQAIKNPTIANGTASTMTVTSLTATNAYITGLSIQGNPTSGTLGTVNGSFYIQSNIPLNATRNSSYTQAEIDLNSVLNSSATIILYVSSSTTAAEKQVAQFSPNGAAILGTSTNDSASAGNIGEVVRS